MLYVLVQQCHIISLLLWEKKSGTYETIANLLCRFRKRNRIKKKSWANFKGKWNEYGWAKYRLYNAHIWNIFRRNLSSSKIYRNMEQQMKCIQFIKTKVTELGKMCADACHSSSLEREKEKEVERLKMPECFENDCECFRIVYHAILVILYKCALKYCTNRMIFQWHVICYMASWQQTHAPVCNAFSRVWNHKLFTAVTGEKKRPSKKAAKKEWRRNKKRRSSFLLENSQHSHCSIHFNVWQNGSSLYNGLNYLEIH